METTKVQLVIINHNVAEIVRQFAHYIFLLFFFTSAAVHNESEFQSALLPRKGNFDNELSAVLSCDARTRVISHPAHIGVHFGKEITTLEPNILSPQTRNGLNKERTKNEQDVYAHQIGCIGWHKIM